MMTVIVLILFISFLLALWSVIFEQSTKDWQQIAHKLKQERIKGGIILEKGKEPKHYSSYS